MKETEITVQVFQDLESVKDILEKQGFRLIEKPYQMIDYYYSKLSTEELLKLDYKNIIQNSIIVRDIKYKIHKRQLVFKNKTLDENNNVIFSEQYITNLDSISNTLKIFDFINLNRWTTLKQDLFVYEKGDIQFALQEIEGLGLFIEYEEDATMSNLNEKEKINLMYERLQGLGLEIGEDYSCKKVYMKFLKENNL